MNKDSAEYRIYENDLMKGFKSPYYNFLFNKKSGEFMRWGKTIKDDPEFSPFGPEIVDMEISTICSKACKFCYKGNTGKGTNMSFETFTNIFKKLPKTVTQIAFGIGDLNANTDLLEIFTYCRAYGVVPNVTVNGQNISDLDIEWLSKICGAVAVSHYNEKECYDTVRRLAAAELKQVNIHKLLCEETYEECFKLIDDSKTTLKDSLNAIVFLWLKPKGPRNTLHALTSLDKYKKLVDYALDRNASIGFDSCSASNFTKAIDTRKNKKQLIQMVDSCESTCFSYYINADGYGYPCSFCEGEGFKGVNLAKVEDFVKEVWYDNETMEFRKKLIKNKDCNGCRKCNVFNLEVK